METLNRTVIVKPAFCFVLALTLLVLPIKWVFAWICASAFHELCHYGALKLSGCKVFRIQIDVNGAVMDTDLLSCSQEILCALAGPLGGLSLLLIARWCPRIAICACFQSVYNLIPLFPLDGGRVVSCIVDKMFSEEQGKTVKVILENTVLSAFFLLGGYAAFVLKLGMLPVLFAVILIVKNKIVKISCKQPALGVE